MKKVVWFSDFHLGLKTSEIDRTEEIVQVCLQAVKRAVAYKKQGIDVRLVIGGDVFQHNDPSDFLISQFIRIINPAVVVGIPIDIVVGNHDSIANPEKKSCLESFKKMKGSYKCVSVIDDIKSIKWFTADFGHIHLTYFPHITKAHLEGGGYETTQDYIDKRAEKIFKKIGPGQHQIVFSHLNVRGLIPGSEENLLKKSEVWFPDIMTGTEEHKAFVGSIPPLVIQGHIHCLDEETEVLTDSGWKSYGELDYSDKVLTRHLASGNDSYEKIEDIIVDDYSGEMVAIENNVSNHLVTPNHKLCYLPASKNNYVLEEVSEIKRKVLHIPCTSNVSGTGIHLSDDLLRMVVWTCADGSFDQHNCKLSFHLKKQRKIERLKELITRLSCKFAFVENSDGTVKINILKSCKIGKWLFENFQQEKVLPEWLRDANSEQAKIILETYAETDGNYQKKNKKWVQIGSVVEQNIDILQEIFVRNSISCKKNFKEINTVNNKMFYYLSVNRFRWSVEVKREKSFKRVQYNGKVWCVTVKNSNFLVRRRGTVYFTGNSRQKHENINVIGAPLFCDFGEKEKKKYFCEIDVPETFNEKFKIHYIRTKCLKFVELEFDLTKQKEINPAKYKKKIKGAIVKLNFIVDGHQAQQDWEAIRKGFQKYAHYVKPIVPRYMKDRVTRNEKQSLSLPPADAVKVWMKTHKPKRRKELTSLALDYIERVL